MARARNIKPALLDNEVLGEADPINTLAFIGLWMIADKEGRIEDRPKRIRAQVFPFRSDVDMNIVLDWLNVNAFITRYQSNVGPIISIVKWSKHQRPHHKEAPSVLPAESLENNGSEQRCSKLDSTLSQDQANVDPTITHLGQPNPPDTGYLIPDSLIPDTGSSDPEEQTSLMPIQKTIDVINHLAVVHGYDEIRLRTKQQNTVQIRQWLDDGVTLGELDDAIAVSRARLTSSGDDRNPPIGYLAKVLASNRKQADPVKTPASNHSGFTADRYAIDDTARKFKIAGGEA